MILVNFSATNYRSITRANRIRLGPKTILIGPNNEGKSNLLQALRTSLALLETFSLPTPRRAILRRDYRQSYFWDIDFPISLQEAQPNGQTTFRLEFDLNAEEIVDFKAQIGSSLNGTLPIELRIGKKGEPNFKVVKQGRSQKALSKKADRIAQFVGSRIEFNYVPAIRTAEAATDVVARMVNRRLAGLQQDTAYQEALRKVRELQEPILEEIAAEVTETLRTFLPEVSQVSLSVPDFSGYRPGLPHRHCEIVVDDGTPTTLDRKGDGVKSLAAISLMYRSPRTSAASILALEEPESHLHPKAIHTLKRILDELSEREQLVIATHNPLFVDRVKVDNNILVVDQGARPAKTISEVRDLLGVQVADNLADARVVLVVEGESDERVFRAVLPALASEIGEALRSGDLIVDPIGGAGKLTYKLGLLRTSLCVYHVFLDNDDAGRRAAEAATQEGVLRPADLHLAVCNGMKNAELEDCVASDVYVEAVRARFGVDLSGKAFRSSSACWSERVRRCFRDQGRLWSQTVKKELKMLVADSVESASFSREVLGPVGRSGAIRALAVSLEEKIQSIS